MNRHIFISYRRTDSEGYAGWLFDRLSSHFGGRTIFMDVAAIDAGVDFAREIEQAVQACDVLLALIGPQWLTAKDAQGKLRLEDPGDYVRLEIATALARGIRVIPVLLQGASMPGASALPEDLKPLVMRNAIELSATRFHADVDRLIKAIERAMDEAERGKSTPEIHAPVDKPHVPPAPVPPAPEPTPLPVKPTGKIIAATAILLGFLLLALFVLRPGNTPLVEASPTSTIPATQASTPTLEIVPTTPAPSSLPPCPEKSTTRYGFDCGHNLWSVKVDPNNDSLAVTHVATAVVPNEYGVLTTVMALTVDFTGAPTPRAAEDRDKGEVEVDLEAAPPAGYRHGVVDDLAGKMITAYVWVSKGASGDPEHLNGFQLFLRDRNSISCYGNWKNIDPGKEENWFRVVWEEPTMEEKQADKEVAEKEGRKPKCDPAFNINDPLILGLKIAIGDNSEKEFTELLTIYLDDIDWISDTHIVTPGAP